jgi:hypothetical protein
VVEVCQVQERTAEREQHEVLGRSILKGFAERRSHGVFTSNLGLGEELGFLIREALSPLRVDGAAQAVRPGSANAIGKAAADPADVGIRFRKHFTSAGVGSDPHDNFGQFGEIGRQAGADFGRLSGQAGLLQMLPKTSQFAAKADARVLERLGQLRGSQCLKMLGVTLQFCQDLVPSLEAVLVQSNGESGLKQPRLGGSIIDSRVRDEVVDGTESFLGLGSRRANAG